MEYILGTKGEKYMALFKKKKEPQKPINNMFRSYFTLKKNYFCIEENETLFLESLI